MNSKELFSMALNMAKPRYIKEIVNFIDSRINSGINNKIQIAKRKARGYRNMTNFINMIYFIAGKLQFDYPRYPL